MEEEASTIFKSVEAEKLDLRESLVVMANADDVHMSGSGALAVVARHDVEAERSGACAMIAGGDMTLTQSCACALAARRAEVRSGWVGMVVSSEVELGEGSTVLLDPRASVGVAAAFGAAFAAVLAAMFFRRR